jgi:hypothetical protein
MLLRRAIALLLLTSIAFAFTIYQQFLWHLHIYYFLIEPILLISLPLALISGYLLKRSQHWEYLQITTNDGLEHTVRCIDTIKAVIDGLPEPDKYLI